MEVRAKRQRVVGSRYSKKGCRTCRIRRVKCDEARPTCKNCVSTGRTCDGYSPETTPNHAVASKRPLLPAPTSSATVSSPPPCVTFSTTAYDRETFHFFAQNAIIVFTHILPTTEWITLALQLSLTEPAIYYAISAVGSVASSRDGIGQHRSLTPRRGPLNTGPPIHQYCKATAALQRYIDHASSRQASIEPVLLCCLLFVTYEIYQGETSLALAHLLLGRRAIENSVCSIRSGKKHVHEGHLTCLSLKAVEDILAVFDWLSVDSTHLGQVTATPVGDREANGRVQPSAGLPTYFASVQHAKLALDRIITAASDWRRGLQRLAEERIATTEYANSRPALRACIVQCLSRSIAIHPGHSLLRQQAELIQSHAAWLAAVGRLQKQQDYAARRSMVLMQIQHFSSSFVLQTCRETNDVLTDRFKDQFTHALDLIDYYLTGAQAHSHVRSQEPHLPQPFGPAVPKGFNPYDPLPQRQEYNLSPEPQKSFSLEYSILPALHLICLKCRFPEPRRRALNLFQTANRREGLQWSGEWAHYADAMITLEETLAAGSSDATIPEEARSLETILEPIRLLKIKMICARYRHEGDGRLEVTEYRGAGLPPLRLQPLVQHVLPFKAHRDQDVVVQEREMRDLILRTAV